MKEGDIIICKKPSTYIGIVYGVGYKISYIWIENGSIRKMLINSTSPRIKGRSTGLYWLTRNKFYKYFFTEKEFQRHKRKEKLEQLE